MNFYFTPPKDNQGNISSSGSSSSSSSGDLIISNDEFSPESVLVEYVDVSSWEGGRNKYVAILHDVLTPEECKEMIAETEERGYTPALLNIGNGVEKAAPEIRKSFRCIIDDDKAAKLLWERIELVLRDDQTLMTASEITGRSDLKAIGLNNRFRYLRYDTGDYFVSHRDGSYRAPNGDQSYVTCQLYLNDGEQFQGGATNFLDERTEEVKYAMIPKPGSILLFQHDCYHEGQRLFGGRKYAMRTDVMYRRREDQKEYLP